MKQKQSPTVGGASHVIDSDINSHLRNIPQRQLSVHVYHHSKQEIVRALMCLFQWYQMYALALKAFPPIEYRIKQEVLFMCCHHMADVEHNVGALFLYFFLF